MMVRSSLFASVDPRLGLLLTAVYSSLVWVVSAPVLLLYSVALIALWGLSQSWFRVPPKSVQRSLVFCLFWASLTFLVDTVPAVWQPVLQAGSVDEVWALLASASFLQRLAIYGEHAVLIFWRLVLLMGFTLWLTAHVSPRSLALALVWATQPFLGQKAWKPALALALMASFLPVIHETMSSVRYAARVRHLPDSGWRYWKYALPHCIRMLHAKTLSQATAVVCRRLDVPSAWKGNFTLVPQQCYAVAALLAWACFPLWDWPFM